MYSSSNEPGGTSYRSRLEDKSFTFDANQSTGASNNSVLKTGLVDANGKPNPLLSHCSEDVLEFYQKNADWICSWIHQLSFQGEGRLEQKIQKVNKLQQPNLGSINNNFTNFRKINCYFSIHSGLHLSYAPVCFERMLNEHTRV